MIHREFKEPNAVCCAERDGMQEEWVTYTERIDALREQLVRLGYTAIRVTPFDFSAWKAECDCEQAVLQTAADRRAGVSFKAGLWQRLKQHLFDLFDGKCAYCECSVQHISWGQVEHYRPKRTPEEAKLHPGYFWLAYVPTNLLPCCEACNGARGKHNHFPVRGRHATNQCELADEEPLLLNPYLDDPGEHIQFKVPLHEEDPLALVEGLTEKGCTSIPIYSLLREPLAQYRRQQQRRFLAEVQLFHIQKNKEKRDALVAEVATGRRDCSAACRAALLEWLDAEAKDLAEIERRAVG